jgi:hypothetical protein
MSTTENEVKIIIQEPCEIEYKMFGTSSEIIKLKSGDYFLSEGKKYTLWRGEQNLNLTIDYSEMRKWADYFSGCFRAETVQKQADLF